MYHEVAGTPIVVAALPLKECIKIPGIKDGTLFQKNVRQSLGSSNTVNKGNRVFSPQNWIKTKGCLAGINGAIRNYFSMLPMMPGGTEIKSRLSAATLLKPEDFEYRWSAD
jgi:hypothetical protein